MPDIKFCAEKKTKMNPLHTLCPLLEIRYPTFARFENIFDILLPIDLYNKPSTRNTLNKNLTYAGPLFVALLIVIILSLAVSNSTYGISKKIVSVSDFKKIPPIILHTDDGKQYKFDVDILQDAGHNTGEPSTAVNHLAHGDIVRLKKGEQITITYGSPFGFNDFVKTKGAAISDCNLFTFFQSYYVSMCKSIYTHTGSLTCVMPCILKDIYIKFILLSIVRVQNNWRNVFKITD